jgi:hypothetical protein
MIDEALRDSTEKVEDDEEAETIENTEDEDEDDEVDTAENNSYDDIEDDSQIDNDNLERVLGPLSKKSGGTTGVVLDIEQDETKSQESGSGSNILGPFSSVMNYVTSALSPDAVGLEDFPSQDKYSVEGGNDTLEATELMCALATVWSGPSIEALAGIDPCLG